MTTTVLTNDRVQEVLSASIGTGAYYRPFFYRNMVYTDGVKYFAEQCQAYWVIDVVNSYMDKVIRNHNKTEETYYFISLKVKNNKAKFRIYREVDEKKKTVVRQDIEFTDLPDTEIKLYLQIGQYEPLMFVMLTPSEY